MARISIVLPSLAGGGTERMSVNLARVWLDKGHRVEFVALDLKGELLDLLPSGATTHDLQASRLRHGLIGLYRYLESRRADVILARMWPLTTATVLAWLAARRPGRLYLSEHNHLSSERAGELPMVKATLRLSYPRATGIIAVSQGVKDDLMRLSGLDAGRIRVIHNPVFDEGLPDIGRRHGDESPSSPARRPRHILAVGRLAPQKNHELLIRAFARVAQGVDARLTLLGEGPLRPDLERLVGQLNLTGRVSLPGFVRDTSAYFRSADLFVLSSTHEGFGNVIVEALGYGVPVVSTDCPSGPAEILEHGRHGRLVPVNDREALARAIRESLATRHDPMALRERARLFLAGTIAHDYLDYFGLTDEQLPDPPD